MAALLEKLDQVETGQEKEADPVAVAVLRVASPARRRNHTVRPCVEPKEVKSDKPVARYVPPHRRTVNEMGTPHRRTSNQMDTLLRDAFLEAAAASFNAMNCDRSAAPADPDHLAQLEEFIEEHSLDRSRGYTAGMALRESSTSVQAQVMRQDLQGARNPAGIVLARIRDQGPAFQAPVKGTRIYVLHMRSRSGANLDVKSSSWKTLGKFFQSLEKEGLLTLKPLETDPFVTSINFNHSSLLPLLGTSGVEV